MSDNTRYSLEDLLYLMSRLRDPDDGCPWDREQDFHSIVPFTLEECYELADAIERADYPHIADELGDVLFQVVFYAQLGKEQGLFEFADVVQGIVDKLLRRHPHVFPDGRLDSRRGDSAISPQQVKQNWEQIKSEERENKQQFGILADIPLNFPALTRARKLQKRAAQVGFDWSHVADVRRQLDSELAEMDEACANQDRDAMTAEFGDVLFSMVNLARHLGIDPEHALRQANGKFEGRVGFIEQHLEEGSMADTDMATLERLWQQAKQQGL